MTHSADRLAEIALTRSNKVQPMAFIFDKYTVEIGSDFLKKALEFKFWAIRP